MRSYERLFTKVINTIKKTIYIDAIWRLSDKRFGLYIIKRRNIVGIGLFVVEVVLFDWSDL